MKFDLNYAQYLHKIHPSWRKIIVNSLQNMDQFYLDFLFFDEKSGHWLPGKDKIFNAFSLPFHQTSQILFGESPYPRAQSANGYAFWDDNVQEIFNYFNHHLDYKFTKSVNKATSLRNFLHLLIKNFHQNSVKNSQNKTQNMIKTLPELFQNFLNSGFLLLNSCLVFRNLDTKKQDAKLWQPFVFKLLEQIYQVSPQIDIILLGQISKQIHPHLIQHHFNFNQIIAEHPYNISFISNPDINLYFQKFNLMNKR